MSGTDVVVLYLGCIVAAMLAAAITSVFRTFSISRRCRKLELRCDDIEDRQLSKRGKAAAEARWNQEAWNEEALKGAKSPAREREYANDPLIER